MARTPLIAFRMGAQMALRKNPLTHILSDFLDTAAEINHAVCVAEHERKKTAKKIADDFENIRARGWEDAFVTGNRLAISSARQPGPYRLSIPGPGRTTSKENIAKLASELAYRQKRLCRSDATRGG